MGINGAGAAERDAQKGMECAGWLSDRGSLLGIC